MAADETPDEARQAEAAGEERPLGFEVEMRSPHFDLTPAIRAYTLEHLTSKLAKHARHIQSVIVRFEDANGSRGGVDKVCRVEVLVPHEPPLVVEEVESDLRAAVDLVADRIGKMIEREVERQRKTPRQRGRKLVRASKLLR
jgi:putative sigma-54 modulation protein